MIINLTYIDAETKNKVNSVLTELLSEFDFYYYPEKNEIELNRDTCAYLVCYLAEDFKIFIVKNRWLLC